MVEKLYLDIKLRKLLHGELLEANQLLELISKPLISVEIFQKVTKFSDIKVQQTNPFRTSLDPLHPLRHQNPFSVAKFA